VWDISLVGLHMDDPPWPCFAPRVVSLLATAPRLDPALRYAPEALVLQQAVGRESSVTSLLLGKCQPGSQDD